MFDRDSAPAAVPATMRQATFTHWALATPPDAGHSFVWRFKRLGDRTNDFIEVASDETGYVSFNVTWNVGTYAGSLYLRRTIDGAMILLREGLRVTVTPDESTGGDHRSHAERMVEKIEAVLEGRADSDVSAYTIAGRQITKMPVADLVKWRDFYRLEVARTRPASARGRNTLRIRFT